MNTIMTLNGACRKRMIEFYLKNKSGRVPGRVKLDNNIKKAR